MSDLILEVQNPDDCSVSGVLVACPVTTEPSSDCSERVICSYLSPDVEFNLLLPP